MSESENIGILRISGPEGVPLDYELASILERALAVIFDFILIVCISIVLGIFLLVLGFALHEIAVAFFLVSTFVLRYFYFAFFEARWHGITPGKRILNLRVIARDGTRLGGDSIFARNLMREVEIFLPLGAWFAPQELVGSAPVWMWMPALLWVFLMSGLPLFTRLRTRAGDLLGGTAVVRVPKVILQPDATRGERRKEQRIAFQMRHLNVYGEHELETLASIVRDIDAGRALAEEIRTIAQTIARKIGYTGPEPEFATERFLRNFYAAQRRVLEERLVFGKRKADKHDKA